MKALPLAALWTVLFILMLITFSLTSLLFWGVFLAWCLTSIYMEKHQDRLLRELEDEK
jgi:hypothetical protein